MSFLTPKPLKFEFKDLDLSFTKEEIIGKLTSDSTYKERAQTSFQVLAEWADIITTDVNLAIFPASSHDEDSTDVTCSVSSSDLLDFYSLSAADKDNFLLFYNKLKQVFSFLEKLILVEIYIFVSLLTLFSQEFGGNRDLPVAAV